MCNKVRRAVTCFLLNFLQSILHILKLENNRILYRERLCRLRFFIRLTLIQQSEQPNRSTKMTVSEFLKEKSSTSPSDMKGILFA